MDSRLPEHTSLLLSLTPEEKIERVKRENMRSRGIVVEEYKHRMICTNEFPFTNRGAIQLVARYYKSEVMPSNKHMCFFMETIRRKYSHLTLTHNATQDQSVKSRFHFHLYSQ